MLMEDSRETLMWEDPKHLIEKSYELDEVGRTAKHIGLLSEEVGTACIDTTSV
jgi:hypothetical protein